MDVDAKMLTELATETARTSAVDAPFDIVPACPDRSNEPESRGVIGVGGASTGGGELGGGAVGGSGGDGGKNVELTPAAANTFM